MIPRTLSSEATRAFEQYPIITLTGPRQSGKTTLARAAFDLPYVNLEAPDQREFATKDPRGFLDNYPSGAIFDEIQRVPELTSYLQVRVDATNRAGQYVLTGNHNFAIREQLSQSLAGRTALLSLLPFSYDELLAADIACENHFEFIATGGYPRIYDMNLNAFNFYRDYVGTYLERDLRQLSSVRDIAQFQVFLGLCAANIGQILNLNRLASDAGISQTTATQWLNLLEASFIVYRLRPFFTNTRKRLVKRPKLYFYDSGIASFLLGLSSSDHVQNHPLRGALFENAVIGEVFKFNWHRNRHVDAFYYRDSNGNEVDLLLRLGGTFLPIEIKSGKTFTKDYMKGLDYFSRNFYSQGGWIVYAGDETQRRSDDRSLIAVNDLPGFLAKGSAPI